MSEEWATIEELIKVLRSEARFVGAGHMGCDWSLLEDAADVIEALQARIAADGMAVVPVKPTEAMIAAAHVGDPLGCDVEPEDAKMIYERIWQFMLVAVRTKP